MAIGPHRAFCSPVPTEAETDTGSKTYIITTKRDALLGMGEKLLALASNITEAGVRLPFSEAVVSQPAPATWTEWLHVLALARAGACCKLLDEVNKARTLPISQGAEVLRCRAEDLLRHAMRVMDDSAWSDWLKAPLIGAASQGDSKTVTTLLKAGAGGRDKGIGVWMIPGGDGRTLLHAAAAGGHVDVVEDLLRAGAGVVVNAMAGGGGFSPFHVAAMKGSVPVAIALARAGAAVHRRAPYKESALHLAASIGNSAMVTALVSDLRVAVEGKDEMGATALHAAAWHGHDTCVRSLISLGAEVDDRDDCSMTSLFKAARGSGGESAGCDVMRELLHAGADVVATSADGETALHVACAHGHPRIVALLLRHEADELATCDVGNTAEDVTRDAEKRGVISPDAANMVLAALASAPAGRAWRRRGWLAILRARPKLERKKTMEPLREELEGEEVEGEELTSQGPSSSPPSTTTRDALKGAGLEPVRWSATPHWRRLRRVRPRDGCDDAQAGMLDLTDDPMEVDWDETSTMHREPRPSVKRAFSADDSSGRFRDFLTPLLGTPGGAMDVIEEYARERFHDLVVRTLEVADGPFQMIVGFI